ncbi:hypothetical protein [Peptidiphaga gingivicola]|uniref:hypothetical protein n=1 Tax=Peptidiphaga gingivicola TaxID=2741497 RepID=UPI0012E98C61|nr:hypothetical protein [Peptidiphaga gingivicola]
MTTPSKKKSNVLYAFLALSAFILMGCRTEATIEVHANGKTKEVLIFEDDNGQMASVGRTCENLKKVLPGVMRFAQDAKIEDITTSGGPLTCKLTSDKPLEMRDKLVDNGDHYTFTVPKSPMEATETYEGIRIKLTIQMPSKVTKTNIGKIEGNKVIINNFDYLSTGISITSEKKGSASPFPAPTATSGKKSNTATSKDDNDGFPVWGWGAIGAAVAAASAVIALLARRKKRHPHSN